jgi:hypothetical protein
MLCGWGVRKSWKDSPWWCWKSLPPPAHPAQDTCVPILLIRTLLVTKQNTSLGDRLSLLPPLSSPGPSLMAEMCSLTFYDTFAAFCWLMWGKMGAFPAAVATWENKSANHIVCQAPLLSVPSVFKLVTFKAVPCLWYISLGDFFFLP